MGVNGGVIGGTLAWLGDLLFGGGRNVVRETAEVFRENAEGAAERGLTLRMGALDQFAAEFAPPQRGRFDRVMDGVNRLPRPALALGTLGLFVSAMVDPVWFAARMQGVALVPEPLWWLLGVVVSFYFGARHQRKAQEFQRDIAATMARAPQAVAQIAALEAMRGQGAETVGTADPGPDAEGVRDAVRPEANPALEAWRAAR
ncbi:MAG TPA: carboxylesterase [Rhodobacteraceae bacterium]|nr:carboxylesterase [Paracoccaceae bacterium]